MLSRSAPPSFTGPGQPGVPVCPLPLIATLGSVGLLYIDTGATGMTVANGLLSKTKVQNPALLREVS